VLGCQKITNDGLTRSVCFIAVPTWQQWAYKGLTEKIPINQVE